jgi:hypothetical protein
MEQTNSATLLLKLVVVLALLTLFQPSMRNAWMPMTPVYLGSGVASKTEDQSHSSERYTIPINRGISARLNSLLQFQHRNEREGFVRKASYRVPSRSPVKRKGFRVRLDHPETQDVETSFEDLLFASKQ